MNKKMSKNKFKKRYVILVLLSGFALWSFTAPQNDKYFEILKNLDIFATMYKEVNANYVDDINPNTFMRVGIDEMLNRLDPYTNFYSEDQIEDARTENTGEYGGIGAQVALIDNKVMILMPDKGFSAAKAGLKRGDEIISIDGIDVKGNFERASEYIKGQASKKVKLKVNRQNVGTLDISVDLEKIDLPNVPYFGMVTADIGIIKQTGFTNDASKEVKSALRELKKQGANKVILDLRGNPGGLLNEAVNISNIFIPKGELVVTTKGKLEETNATYKTLNSSTDEEIPLVVLTSSNSASASEIVAGVIQDYDRGVIVGQKSFGKGLVQRTLPLSYNSQMKVTIAKYYTPSGRCIQALDYGNRNEDGSVGKVPDSLKTLFKTRGGRPVYDGGGVDPDLLVDAKKLAPVTIGMLRESLLLKFGNQYETQIDSIADIKDFQITDKIFNDFKAWALTQDFDYASPLEKEVERLKEVAQSNDALGKIQSQISQIEKALGHDKAADIEANKLQLKQLLKEEFVSRFYLEEGRLEASFENDQDLKQAIQVLNDSAKYAKIIKGQ
ncbi:MAG: peptidase S41 [Cytophagales bacterium CG12_big_fil_rev_8_21_14_0_65_40_12]|nr:MAG: peptidase S41 [Cytophagales bacterium CG12_big_fil_rev_8_21_14_0_65_40_12]PIW03830.1 MAG: peptidase S41 [Cytophagales bacterium CG17_big_fil_post_rev_8_21_14_2_50_40_13]